jgi:hypothetical protein
MNPSLSVRAFTNAETAKLQGIVRHGNGVVTTWQRAQVLLYAAQGLEPPHIAPLALTTEDTVHTVVDTFNTTGIDALYRH